MAASSGFEVLLANHLFVNLAIANLGDSSGVLPSGVAGSLHISLHTADPEAGSTADQTVSECTYTGYNRVAVARSTVGWIVSSSKTWNAAAVSFPAATGGSNTATHFGVGFSTYASSGTLMASGALSASLAISNGITPSFAATTLVVETR